MSVTPICAITDPSVSSTIEWITDCGCTTTSIFEAGSPNSQCASMTSSPLFMSVAESMVIFWPICHVGMLQGVRGRDVRQAVARRGRGTVRRRR